MLPGARLFGLKMKWEENDASLQGRATGIDPQPNGLVSET